MSCVIGRKTAFSRHKKSYYTDLFYGYRAVKNRVENLHLSYHEDRRFFLSRCAQATAAIAFLPAVSWATTVKNKVPWKTGYAYDPAFSTFYQSPETPDRVEWIHDRISRAAYYGQLSLITPVSDPKAWIAGVHTPEHIQMIENIQAYSADYVPAKQIAELAVGYTLGAVSNVCEGKLRNAFCCLRPPGHHAINGGLSGYCYYANAAIAAKFAQETHSIKRILLVDWDVHHGNGTQHLICGDDGILFFDTFETICCGTETSCDDFVAETPDASGSDSDGVSKLRINVQMPSGAGNQVFQTLFDSRLRSAAGRFEPQLVIVSCGFDIKKSDTHGSLQVTAAGISGLTKTVMDIADTHCAGKLVVLLEGGYADSDGANTYHGLAECADSLVATLVSGDIQDESPYFAGQAIKNTRIKNGFRAPVASGHHVTVPATAFSMTVFDCLGKSVRDIRLRPRGEYRFDIRTIRLKPGRYTMRMSDDAGKTLFTWKYTGR
jgi:acetoin utilization deacetylase AcuC-like enzyme